MNILNPTTLHTSYTGYSIYSHLTSDASHPEHPPTHILNLFVRTYIHTCPYIHLSLYVTIKLNVKLLTYPPSLYHHPLHFLFPSQHLSLYQDLVTLSAVRRLITLKTYLLEKDP
jgi:hypothetical protein